MPDVLHPTLGTGTWLDQDQHVVKPTASIQTKLGPRKWIKLVWAEIKLRHWESDAEDLFAWARSKEVGGGC